MKSFKEFVNEERKKRDEKIITELEELQNEMDELKPKVDKYYELSRIHNQKHKEFEKMKKRENLSRLVVDTEYEECEYAEMGSVASDGSAIFKDKEQAESLLFALRNNSNYYYAYVLKWNGEGNYIVKPDWKYDHDGDIVYTATFIKEE